MRYYRIRVISPDGTVREEWNSHRPNGLVNEGALRIEFTLPVTSMTESAGNAELKVWGVPLSYFKQSYNLNGCSIYIEAGMAKGLPLANPNQKGLVLKGKIQATYPLREGTNAYLQMIIIAGSNILSDPRQLIVNWKKGQKLADILKETLKEYQSDIQISDNLVCNFDHIGHYPTYESLSTQLEQYTKSFIKDANYQGVKITKQNGKLYVYDGTKPSNKTVTADFKDFIGQPQWINTAQVGMTMMLRGDILLGNDIKMPERLAAQYAFNSAIENEREKLNFKGTFNAVGITHVGDSRNPHPDAWSTILTVNKNNVAK